MSRLQSAIALLIALLAGCATPENQTVAPSSSAPVADAAQKKAAQTISVIKPIKNVTIEVDYQGGVFYRVRVNNARPTEIKLLWDESTYVATDGKSLRLLRVADRSGLPERAPARQTPSPVASGEKFASDFTGEEWLECARRDCSPIPKDYLAHAQIYLAFEIKGKKVRWLGDVKFAPPARTEGR